MKKTVLVTFTQYYDYDVEVDVPDDEDAIDWNEIEEDAIEKAYKKFEVDMRRPIARDYYDGVETDL